MHVDLPLAGRPVLVVGGGADALGRIATLRHGGADITVVAPAVAAAVADLADRGVLCWLPRDVRPDDLTGVWLVVAASGNQLVDSHVKSLADERKVFCLNEFVPATTPTARSGQPPVGLVLLVGGGPGDPGLITVAGLAAVRNADVLITDRLAPLAVLAEARTDAEILDVSKIPRGATTSQEDINRLLIKHARAGKVVVRLKGGDNFVFGRGGEEWQACAAARVAVQIVPGVSSALAAPALGGIPLTHRTANQGFTVITGHVPPGDPRSTLDYAALAHAGTALIVMMGVGTLGAIADELIRQGMHPQTPAATVADGTLPSQRVVRASLTDITAATAAAGIRPPAVTVIGSVAAFDPDQPAQ